MQEFFRLLESRLELDRPLTVFLAGGMGVHLYTGKRVTTDIDAEFSGRVAVPTDLLSPVDLAVSKISRLADPNKEDIHDLVHAGLTSAAPLMPF